MLDHFCKGFERVNFFKNVNEKSKEVTLPKVLVITKRNSPWITTEAKKVLSRCFTKTYPVLQKNKWNNPELAASFKSQRKLLKKLIKARILEYENQLTIDKKILRGSSPT